jgi:hypothetical protein
MSNDDYVLQRNSSTFIVNYDELVLLSVEYKRLGWWRKVFDWFAATKS